MSGETAHTGQEEASDDGRDPAPGELLPVPHILKQRRLLIDVAGLRILLVDLDSDQYGHLGYELLMAAKAATQMSAILYAFNSLPTPNPGLWRLRPLTCRMIPRRPLFDRLAKALFRRCYVDLVEAHPGLLARVQEDTRRYEEVMARRLVSSDRQKRFRRRLKYPWLKDWARQTERSVKRWFLMRERARARRAVAASRETWSNLIYRPGRLAPWPASADQDWVLPRIVRRARRRARDGTDLPAYLARRSIGDEATFRLPGAAQRRCRALARDLGIADGTPLVCVHVRQAGYKAGREIEEKGGPRRDVVRNADIATYFPAIDRLVAAGYTVVRIGDPSMTPVERPGVVDLATSPRRDPLLEIYFLARCRFLLGSESGPYHVSYLFGTPTLIANATDVIGGYPIRTFDRYLLKRVSAVKGGALLDIDEMLSLRHYAQFRNTDYFRYRDNSPDEILAAVEEMLAVLDGTAPPPSAEQQDFHDRCLAASTALAMKVQYVRKWGADAGFIGRGFVSRVFFDDPAS